MAYGDGQAFSKRFSGQVIEAIRDKAGHILHIIVAVPACTSNCPSCAKRSIDFSASDRFDAISSWNIVSEKIGYFSSLAASSFFKFFIWTRIS